MVVVRGRVGGEGSAVVVVLGGSVVVAVLVGTAELRCAASQLAASVFLPRAALIVPCLTDGAVLGADDYRPKPPVADYDGATPELPPGGVVMSAPLGQFQRLTPSRHGRVTSVQRHRRNLNNVQWADATNSPAESAFRLKEGNNARAS